MGGKRDDAEMLLTGDYVDLDTFAGGATRYTLTDAHGNERIFDLPNDLPFPMALGLQRAYDEWRAAAAADEDAEMAWIRLMGAFSPAIALRNPPIPGKDLAEEIGPAKMAGWINSILMRFQMAQAGMSLDGFLERILEGAAEGEAPKGPSRSS